ncbi:MAG: helix-turn-helix transcriptional regulator [Armatimonadetes bacterium]|nr:helix-turn-helix transcriptional regulator [Armatimonadota bacterium]
MRWINVTSLCMPLPDSDTAGARLQHVFRDVTEHRELEDFGRQVLAALEQLGITEQPARNVVALPTSIAERLTQREVEVLGLLCRGASAKTIAERLYISRSTARKHIQGVLGKLGVHSCLEAVAYVSNTSEGSALIRPDPASARRSLIKAFSKTDRRFA